MSPKWYFNKLRPGDKTREPILGEFFATEAIRNSVEALVREGTQNTLDAAIKKATDPVRVRLLLATGHHALSAVQNAVDLSAIILLQQLSLLSPVSAQTIQFPCHQDG